MTNKKKYLYKDKASTKHSTAQILGKKAIKTSSSKIESGVKAKSPSPATITAKIHRKTYSNSFKREVVTALLSRTNTPKALEQQHNLHPNIIYKWKHQLLAKDPTLRSVYQQSSNNTKKDAQRTTNSSHQSSATSIMTKCRLLFKSVAQIFRDN